MYYNRAMDFSPEELLLLRIGLKLLAQQAVEPTRGDTLRLLLRVDKELGVMISREERQDAATKHQVEN